MLSFLWCTCGPSRCAQLCVEWHLYSFWSLPSGFLGQWFPDHQALLAMIGGFSPCHWGRYILIWGDEGDQWSQLVIGNRDCSQKEQPLRNNTVWVLHRLVVAHFLRWRLVVQFLQPILLLSSRWSCSQTLHFWWAYQGAWFLLLWLSLQTLQRLWQLPQGVVAWWWPHSSVR